MHIPKVILNLSKEYSPDSKAIHQNFAKKFKKIATGNKLSNNPNENNIKFATQTNKLQSDIFSWLFSLDLSTRIKVCSINCKWITKILLQLSLLYKYDNDVIFQLIQDNDRSDYRSIFFNNKYLLRDNEDEEGNDEYGILFTKLYEFSGMKIILSKDKEIIQRKKKENEFIQMIQCISLKSNNDTLLLKKTLLAQKDKFEYYFKTFSNNQIFQSWTSIVTEENNTYNFTPTKWIIPEEKYSLISIFISYFEYSILVNYQYYYFTKQIYEFPHYKKIDELIELNKKLEMFLKEEKIQDTFEIGVLNRIIANIRNNDETRNQMKKQKKINEQIFHLYFKNSYYLGERIINYDTEKIMSHLNEIYIKSIEQFIEMITFIDLDSVFNFNVFIYKELRNQIETLFINKTISDLLSINNSNADKKGSKKKKKKKKKQFKEEEDKSNNQTEKMNVSQNNLYESGKESIESVKLTSNEENNSSQTENSENYSKIDTQETAIKKKPIFLFANTQTKTRKIKQKNYSNDKIDNTNNDTTIVNAVVNKYTNKESQIESNSIKSYTITTQSYCFSTENHNNKKTNTIDSNNETTSFSLSASPQNKPTNYNQLTHGIFQHNYSQPFSTLLISQPHIYPYSIGEAFLSSLSLEISSFSNTVSKNNVVLNPYKKKYKLKIEELIQIALEPKYIYRLLYFGSYISNLSLENSDIDILVIYKSTTDKHISIDTIMNDLVSLFNKNILLFDYINPITTASIPVIKLQCDYGKEMTNEEKKSVEFQYLFDKSELSKVKFDISFMEDSNECLSIPSQKRNDYVLESIVLYPDIKPLMAVMKRLLQKAKLNSSFTGKYLNNYFFRRIIVLFIVFDDIGLL